MKKAVLIFTISVITSAGAVFIYHKLSEKKIGYIKSAVVLQDYKEMIEVTDQFNQELKIVQGNLDTLQSRFEKLKMQEPIVSAKERPILEYKLQVAQNEFEKYNQQATEQMQARRAELTGKVLAKVNEFIQKHGKENGYKLILGTTDDGSILYGLESDDLTKTILDALNENYTSDKNKSETAK